MSQSERVSVTRRIPAPAAAVFAVVTDPAEHVRIDGSGMLVAAVDPAPVRQVGDTFLVDMDRTAIGDLPGVSTYQALNTVTAYEPDRHLEWLVAAPGYPPSGYVWGYLVEPVDASTSDVTSYVDWSGLSPERRAKGDSAGRIPLLPETTMAATLERLDEVLTGRR